MEGKRSLPRFTPVFHWVLRATGDTSVAVAYGIVWQYSQMRDADCHASCTRLAGELGWSRQRVMRHLRALRRLGLIVCTNPFAHGVTRHYVPVSEEEWLSLQDCPLGTPSACGQSPAENASGPYWDVDQEAPDDPSDLSPPRTPSACSNDVPVAGSDRGSHETYPAPVAPSDRGVTFRYR